MKIKSIQSLLIGCLMILASCTNGKMTTKVSSPDGKIGVEVSMVEGQATYQVSYNGKPVIEPSSMGFDFKNMPAIEKGWEIVESESSSSNSSWEMQWGEKRVVVDNFNQLKLSLEEQQAPNRKMNIVFKLYNDGLGFRYEFPEQDAMKEVLITEENTQFNLTGDHKTWWIPGDWDIYEHLYNTTMFSEIDATKLRNHASLAQTSIPNNAVNTPVSMKTNGGVYLSFHEANLTDYSGMTLKVNKEDMMWESCLVGSLNNDYKVKRSVPFNTPGELFKLLRKQVI